ncbi:MAG: S1 RNA-binding domain-containing protein [Lentisphaeria bacterium]|jgi:small subunit ribosomal protein S1
MADEKMDFGALLAQFETGKPSRTTTRVQVGAKLAGKVTAIDSSTVYVDVNAPSDAMADRIEFLDDGGALTVQVGDTVEAICVSAEEGEIRLSRRMNAATADASLMQAHEARIPVEGRVAAETKGGFEVMVGSHKGFCPYSQIDLGKLDAAFYLGQKFLFFIQEYSEHGRRLVLNRRRLLEQEQAKAREQLKERLHAGDRLEGTVKKIMPFGVFVDIGGMDGLVPLSELAWKRDVKAEELVKPGQKVTVVVREIDWDRQRISLSLRAAANDPWSAEPFLFTAGTRHFGTVVKTLNFGAFVELAPGVEGLIPISKLGRGKRLNDAGEAVKAGEALEVLVESVDRERRRLSLSVVSLNAEEAAAAVEQVRLAASVVPGAELPGVVEALKEFGAFVRLPGGKSGLLHISRMGLPEGPARRNLLPARFAPGKELTVRVEAVEGDRIRLAIPGVAAQESTAEQEEAAYREFSQAQAARQGGNLGSLGDLLGGLDKLKLK